LKTIALTKPEAVSLRSFEKTEGSSVSAVSMASASATLDVPGATQ
jgi:hypothetical protein